MLCILEKNGISKGGIRTLCVRRCSGGTEGTDHRAPKVPSKGGIKRRKRTLWVRRIRSSLNFTKGVDRQTNRRTPFWSGHTDVEFCIDGAFRRQKVCPFL